MSKVKTKKQQKPEELTHDQLKAEHVKQRKLDFRKKYRIGYKPSKEVADE